MRNLSYLFFAITLLFLLGISLMSGQAQTDVASPAQLAAAMAAWERSGHASTYDNGMGADTTCARCKSPLNWDPLHPAAESALDCASCKRIPGQPRPILTNADPVPEADWHNIGCPICHEPVGDSYRITPAFWNQASGTYEPVSSSSELCAHCHEGRHGFEVTEEVVADAAHPGWDCLNCHGPHGDSVQCVDCHDLSGGAAAQTHRDHPQVHCSACHDRAGLGIWWDEDPASSYLGMVVTRRFAHTLTSWPSHNLQTTTDCRRCHHARGLQYPAIAQTVSCNNAACHPGGAVLNWCPYWERSK